MLTVSLSAPRPRPRVKLVWLDMPFGRSPCSCLPECRIQRYVPSPWHWRLLGAVVLPCMHILRGERLSSQSRLRFVTLCIPPYLYPPVLANIHVVLVRIRNLLELRRYFVFILFVITSPIRPQDASNCFGRDAEFLRQVGSRPRNVINRMQSSNRVHFAALKLPRRVPTTWKERLHAGSVPSPKRLIGGVGGRLRAICASITVSSQQQNEQERMTGDTYLNPENSPRLMALLPMSLAVPYPSERGGTSGQYSGLSTGRGRLLLRDTNAVL